MEPDHPLTFTVEQAGRVLGVSRSIAYELVRSGDLSCIRLRRRIVVPAAHLAERLGVPTADVWAAAEPTCRSSEGKPIRATLRTRPAASTEALRLF